VGGFVPLLAGLELTGAVVTADALHTHADAAGFLVTGKQAHYLFTVKANQPTLLGRCQRLAWHQVPVLDRTRDRAHGRIELRTSRPSRSAGSGSRTLRRSSRSSARSATWAPGGGRPWSCTRWPACHMPRPALVGSPT
jgi:predicted transposase YbfD/YdcC